MALGQGFSRPALQDVSFDPGVVAAGDRVDITASLHYDIQDGDEEEKNIDVSLSPDNTLAEEYVTIEDVNSDEIFIYPGGGWNQQFQVKVHGDAPSGQYRFTVDVTESGQNSSVTYEEEFTMPVEKEGVDLTADVVKTSPDTPRSGDNDVRVDLRVSNTGSKTVEEVEIYPEFPENISSSDSMTEKLFIDRIGREDSSNQELEIDLDEKLKEGVYWINLSTSYEDSDSNSYQEDMQIPLRVEGRPDLELRNSSMQMKAGETSSMTLDVVNTGLQDAEAVSVRVIAQSSQPFSLSDRSDYIGELEPGEEGKAVLEISSDRSAALKSHQLKIELRANGDSDEGDSSVYTFTDNMDVQLTERSDSNLVYLGIGAAALVALAAVFKHLKSGKGEEN
ncbi:COG1361 S-layer family protein [Candidatus Nanohalovita haloferacivicina]|uniref:COG1361 S-layer family protein n=1 Tax=Candidatus Nanohalovita haloferacivicina TaxID=2978046 RepID=UPI00325F97B9|nr:S-layer domain protein [Candidatus Nanohalobia archaeon BNXNv]